MDSPASSYWEESTVHSNLKFERYGTNGGPSPRACKEEQNSFRYCESSGNLNFSTAVNSEDDDYNYLKKKISRDPMSHRIIEKRRRDRMNNCLADLSRLIPADYLKKGRGRIEKTEIIEMAIKHMKYLQAHACSHIDGYNNNNNSNSNNNNNVDSRPTSTPNRHNESDDTLSPPGSVSKDRASPSFTEHFRHGFEECLSETMHFLIQVEGFFPHDALCVSLVNHLRKHCDKQTDRMSSNGEVRQIINCNESVMSTSSSVSSGISGNASSNSKVSNGDAGSSSSSDGGGSAVGCRNSDDIYDGHHTSQLRDILTCPSVSSTNTVSRMQLAVDSQSPSTTTANGSNSSNDSNHSSSSSLYKFKNNIKQRFSAEHPERNGMINLSSSMSNRTSGDSIPYRANKRRLSTDTATPPPPSSQSASGIPLKHSSLQSIPIFMLHSKGSYYIPLTVDYETLAPYLSEMSLDMHPANLSSIVLHPVTISVNFNQQKVCSPSPSGISNGWTHQNGVTTNGFLPLQKWTSCGPE